MFDKGMLQDDKGNDIDFKNTIILLTSNVGTDTIMKVCADPDTLPDAERAGRGVAARLAQVFQARPVGANDGGPLFPALRRSAARHHPVAAQAYRRPSARESRDKFTYADNVISTIASRCKEVESGARNVDHILNGTLLPTIAGQFLAHMAEGKPVTRAHVATDATGGFVYEVE